MNKAQRKINTHKPKFDLTTHVRDGKGKIVDENHYRLTIVDGVHKYERPPGSGFFYDAAGTLIKSPKGSDKKSAAPEKEFNDQEVSKELAKLREENAKLKAAQQESEEIEMTADDVEVDDVKAVPAAQADNSEEIELMKQAGATAEAAKIQEASKKPVFQKQPFLK